MFTEIIKGLYNLVGGKIAFVPFIQERKEDEQANIQYEFSEEDFSNSKTPALNN